MVPEEPKAATSSDADAGDAPMPAASGPSSTSIGPPAEPDSGRAGLVVGIGLVLIGVWFLVRDYLPDIDWNLLWPAILIGIGALILISSARRTA